MWHQEYSVPCYKVIGFVSCRVILKVLVIGAAENSWGDLNEIKSGKRSTISSDVSEKHIIVYTYTFIESAIIEQYHSDKTLMIIVQVTLGIKMMMILINSSKNGVRKNHFQVNHNLLQES